MPTALNAIQNEAPFTSHITSAQKNTITHRRGSRSTPRPDPNETRNARPFSSRRGASRPITGSESLTSRSGFMAITTSTSSANNATAAVTSNNLSTGQPNASAPGGNPGSDAT